MPVIIEPNEKSSRTSNPTKRKLDEANLGVQETNPVNKQFLMPSGIPTPKRRRLNDAFASVEETSPISINRLIPSRIPSPFKSKASPYKQENEEEKKMIKNALMKHLPFLKDDQTSEAFSIKRYS